LPQRETNLQAATRRRTAICIIPRLFGAVLFINQHKKPSIEEDLFRLPLADIVFVRTLSAVAIVPVKSNDLA
jgi:hypothetical protein